MGVTGAIFKGLTFDGEDSKDYGVYITGQAVYNSPERDVEMISIPGRNGAFALDRGRFSNIEVTYPAGLFGVDAADFAQAIADFRNMLGSRKGYCRLEDDYNPGEYREAVFKAGVEVTPASLESGQFDIVFECKPQRWLTSGEDAIEVEDGGTITNPTLFGSQPLISFGGFGDIAIEGQGITVYPDSVIGKVITFETTNETVPGTSQSYSFDPHFFNPGDAFEVKQKDGYMITFYAVLSPLYKYTDGGYTVSNFTGFVTGAHQCGISLPPSSPPYNRGSIIFVDAGSSSLSYTFGTAQTYSGGCTFTALFTDGVTYTIPTNESISYDGDHTFTMSVTISGGPQQTGMMMTSGVQGVGVSSLPTATNTKYIDCDLGEAYIIEGGEILSANNLIYYGAVPPTLSPGSNSITYDNTITDFEIVPKWWQL